MDQQMTMDSPCIAFETMLIDEVYSAGFSEMGFLYKYPPVPAYGDIRASY